MYNNEYERQFRALDIDGLREFLKDNFKIETDTNDTELIIRAILEDEVIASDSIDLEYLKPMERDIDEMCNHVLSILENIPLKTDLEKNVIAEIHNIIEKSKLYSKEFETILSSELLDIIKKYLLDSDNLLIKDKEIFGIDILSYLFKANKNTIKRIYRRKK